MEPEEWFIEEWVIVELYEETEVRDRQIKLVEEFDDYDDAKEKYEYYCEFRNTLLNCWDLAPEYAPDYKLLKVAYEEETEHVEIRKEDLI